MSGFYLRQRAQAVRYTLDEPGAVERSAADRFAESVGVGDFGADPEAPDNTAAIQAAIDAVRASWDATLNTFRARLDFGGRLYKVTGSLNAALIRQPGFTLRNGGIYASCTGKIALDMAGTNAAVLSDFAVYGDPDNVPAVGIYIGRAQITGAFPAAASHRWNNVQTNGYFSKSAVVNFASEVSQAVACLIINKSRSVDAYSWISCGHAQCLDDYVGGLASDFATLPAAGDGSHSNTLHNLQQAHIQRHSDLYVQITGISRANPAVVSVTPADLAAANLSNGDEIWLSDIAGMTQLNFSNYTIANINVGAGTFELSGVDSSAFGVFADGHIRNRTGPAMLLNITQRMVHDASYLLAYGSPPIVVDMNNGGPIRSCKFGMHCEPSPRRVIDLHYTGGSYAVIQGLDIDALMSSQTISDELIGVTGGGKVRIDTPRVYVANMPAAPVNGLFHPPGDFILRNADINVPIDAALNDPDDFAEFSGTTHAADTQRLKIYGVGHLFMKSPGQALDKVGLRWNGSRYVTWDNQAGAERALMHNEVASASVFVNIGAAVNTYGKYQGKPIFDATTGRPVFSTGSSAAAQWNFADGTTAYTPT